MGAAARGAAMGILRARLICLFCLSMAGVAHGQMVDGGTIVKMVSGDLVYIDKGANAKVMTGDIFDIVSDETVYHPLTDSVLAVTTTTIGAIKILQVFEKTALAKLVHIQLGKDPMLKQVVPISGPERLADVESQMLREELGLKPGLSRRLAILPGLYQMKMGERGKGWVLMGLEAATLVAGLSYRSSSNDWKDQYDRLTNPRDDFDRYLDGAKERRTWSNRFLTLAAVVYAYSWFDVLWQGGGIPINMKADSRQASRLPALQLGVGADQSGSSLLQLVHRF